MADKVILEASNISIMFGGLKAVNNFNIKIKENELVGLIGPNGAGKTTIFNILTGVYKPTTGKVFLDGNDITNLPSYKRVEKGITRTFQNIRLCYLHIDKIESLALQFGLLYFSSLNALSRS